MKEESTFTELVQSIRTAHRELTAHAGRAVNISLTLRNWLIGYYIAEYELTGKDRAEYGENLIVHISDSLKRSSIPSCGKRQLYKYLQFYHTYPQIVGSVTAQLQTIHLEHVAKDLSKQGPIVGSATPQSKLEASH